MHEIWVACKSNRTVCQTVRVATYDDRAFYLAFWNKSHHCLWNTFHLLLIVFFYNQLLTKPVSIDWWRPRSIGTQYRSLVRKWTFYHASIIPPELILSPMGDAECVRWMIFLRSICGKRVVYEIWVLRFLRTWRRRDTNIYNIWGVVILPLCPQSFLQLVSLP